MFERFRDHPVKLGLLSAMLFAAWAAAVYDSLLVGVVCGVLLGLLQIFLWRSDGWARWSSPGSPAPPHAVEQ